jgi:hypothetical protein
MSCSSSITCCGGSCDSVNRIKISKFQSFLIAAPFFLQMPLMAYMAALETGGTIVLYALGGLIAFGLFHLDQSGFLSKNYRKLLAMVTLGNLGMLIGWLTDVSFLPLVRDSVCLCGCPKSPLGWGILSHLNWMQLGMLIGGIFAIKLIDFNLKNWAHTLGCSILMLVGMMIGATAIAWVPINHPQIHFFITITVMTLAMILGMILYARIQRFCRK